MSSKAIPETHRVETHRIEYKRELTPELDLEKEVIAFLNSYEGGFIYLGIDKTGQRLPALSAGFIEPTLPDKPNSRLQQYRLTEQGRGLLQ